MSDVLDPEHLPAEALEATEPLPEGAPGEPATEEATEPAPEPDPPRAPADDRIERLARENADLRQTLNFVQQRMQQQAPPEPQPRAPWDDPSLPPEWQQSLRVTAERLTPYFQQMTAQQVRVAEQQAQAATAAAERAALAGRIRDFWKYEQEAVVLQQQLSQNLGRYIPLEAALQLAVGARALRGELEPSGSAERRTQARNRAKAAGSAETARPVGTGTVPRGPLTEERVKGMPTEEFLKAIGAPDLTRPDPRR